MLSASVAAICPFVPLLTQSAAARALRRDGATLWVRVTGEPWLRAGAERLGFFDVIQADLPNESWNDRTICHLAALPRLETLIVGEHRVQRLRQLARCRCLQTLVLDSAALSESELAELRRALPRFVIRSCQRQALAGLRGVGELTIMLPQGAPGDEHRSAHLDPTWFEQAVELTISDKRLTTDEMTWLQPLDTLRTLRLTAGELTTEAAKAISELDGLRSLVLFDSPIDDLGLSYFSRMTRLESLWLNASRATNDGLSQLGALAGLQVLELPDTTLTDDGLERLSALAHLRELNIGRTRITDAGLAHLKKLPLLEVLQLYGTRVTDAGLEHLEQLERLQFLYLDDTQVTSNGLLELQTHLPATRISPSVMR